jgi:hypothetical protein
MDLRDPDSTVKIVRDDGVELALSLREARLANVHVHVRPR